MRGFKLASLNVTSIIKHIDELRVLLVDHSIDVLAINETRLDSTINDNEVHISGYEIVRRDRSVNGKFGGGVCFYVRCNINFLPRFDMSIDQLENYVSKFVNLDPSLFSLQLGIDLQIHPSTNSTILKL